MIARRRKSYLEQDRLVSKFNEKFVRITGGSKSEGFSSCFETDYDRLNLYKSVVCICNQCECRQIAVETESVFELSSEKCHPGHFKLKLLKLQEVQSKNEEKQDYSNLDTKPELENTSKDVELIARSLVNIHKQCLLSSDRFMQNHEEDILLDINGGWKKCDRSGPSVPSTRGLYHRDDVFAFRCPCQRHLLADWASRQRRFNWPEPDLIEAVMEIDANVVPVGCPESEHKDLEWRICFGERVLSDSFNETQSMLYVILKYINSSVFSSVCSDISSYVMKNIVFWMIEDNPSDLFSVDNLLHLVWLALQMLHKAVKFRRLSYYMLTDRNLLHGKINAQQREDLLECINIAMHDIQKIILNLPKINKALQIPLEKLRADGRVRDELESLELYRQEIIASYWRPDLRREEVDELCWQDKKYRENRFKMYDIVWPDWKSSLCKGTVELSQKAPTDENNEAFNEHYLKFAESYYDIIWPRIKRYVKSYADFDLETMSRQNVVNFMAVMRLKIEKALR